MANFSAVKDVIGRELRVGGEQLLWTIAVSNAAGNDADRNARTLNARIAMMDRRVDGDSITPVHLTPLPSLVVRAAAARLPSSLLLPAGAHARG